MPISLNDRCAGYSAHTKQKLTTALTLTYRLQVQPNASAPRQARRFVARRTPETKREDVALVVSELVTNAVIHRSSDQPIDVLLEVDDNELLVEVQQSSPVLPALGVRTPTSQRLVDAALPSLPRSPAPGAPDAPPCGPASPSEPPRLRPTSRTLATLG